MRISKILLCLAAGVFAFSGAAIAQDDDHGFITVRATTVKPGMAREYRELQAQLVASRKAAGHSGVDTYQVIRGPSGAFYSVTYADNHADMGGSFDSGMSDGDWQRWIVRITDLVDHTVVTTLRTHADLNIAPASDSPANMVLLRYTEVGPTMGGAHHEWLANELVPAMKEGNTRGWNVSNVVYGENVGTWISASRVDSWEQLDGPGPFSHLSEGEGPALFEGYASRAKSARTELIRYLPDLSY